MNLQNNTNYALCNYGTDFLAAFQKENIFGVQFHPELKSTPFKPHPIFYDQHT